MPAVDATTALTDDKSLSRIRADKLWNSAAQFTSGGFATMSGPIVRTGTTPKFWENWEQAFGKGKGKTGSKSKKKVASSDAKASVKKTAKKTGKKAAKKKTKK